MAADFRRRHKIISESIRAGEEGMPSSNKIRRAASSKELAQIFINSPKVLKVFDGDYRKLPATVAAGTKKDMGKAAELKAKASAALDAGRLKEAVEEYSAALRFCYWVVPGEQTYEDDIPEHGEEEDYDDDDDDDDNDDDDDGDNDDTDDDDTEVVSVQVESDEALDSTMFPILLSERMGALVKLSRFREALHDAERALLAGLPRRLKPNVKLTKAECLLLLGQVEEGAEAAEQCRREVDAYFHGAQKNDYLKRIENVAAVRPPNVAERGGHYMQACEDRAVNVPTLPGVGPTGLSRLVDRAGAPGGQQGRFIRASEDVRPGDVLCSEAPFACALAPRMRSTHCYQCFGQMRYAVEPCRGCALVAYCSSACEAASWKTHRHECAAMGLADDINCRMAHLALRTVLTAGLEACHQAALGKRLTGQWAAYGSVRELVTHFEKRTEEDRVLRACVALHLVGCGSGDSFAPKDEDLLVFVSELIHVLQVLPCNAHEISALDRRDEVRSGKLGATPVELGAGIYPLLSLFNHSCDPDVTRVFYGVNAVVRAVLPVSKGTQVFDNYGMLWATEGVKGRQAKLSDQYHFSCSCPACKGDWQLYEELSVRDMPRLRCAKCAEPLDATMSNCLSCSHFTDRKKSTTLVVASYEGFTAALVDYLEGRMTGSEALPTYLRFVSFVSRLALRPHKTFCDVQESMKRVFATWGNVLTNWRAEELPEDT